MGFRRTAVSLSMRMNMVQTAWLACVLALAACTGQPVVLAAGRSDTVIANSMGPTVIRVEGRDAKGRVARVGDLRYQRVAGDPLVVTHDGRVTCDKRGDAVVRVSDGRLSARLYVLCRPIKGFLNLGAAQLVVGGGAVSLPLVAIGLDDMPVDLLAGSLTLEDTTVAVLRGMMVYPKAPGFTAVDAMIGDCETSIGVMVVDTEPHVSDPVELRPNEQFVLPSFTLARGEARSWPLPADGWFEIRLRQNGGTPGELALATTATNCVAAGDGEAHRYCIAEAGATVVVQNVARTGGAMSASLLIRRLVRDSERKPVVRRPQVFRRRAEKVCPSVSWRATATARAAR